MAHKMSSEQRAAISRGLKGKAKSLDHKAAISSALRSKSARVSKDTKAFIQTAGRQGLVPHAKSSETHRAIGESLRGKPKSPEHRAAIAKARKGHLVSFETRRKLAKAAFMRRSLEADLVQRARDGAREHIPMADVLKMLGVKSPGPSVADQLSLELESARVAKRASKKWSDVLGRV